MFQREIDQVEIDALQQHVRGEQQITFSGIYYSGIVPGAQHRGCVTYGKLAGKPLYQSELSELGYLRSFRRHIFLFIVCSAAVRPICRSGSRVVFVLIFRQCFPQSYIIFGLVENLVNFVGC